MQWSLTTRGLQNNVESEFPSLFQGRAGKLEGSLVQAGPYKTDAREEL